MLKIKKKHDRDFVILNLTDFNMDINDWNNIETVNLLNRTIDELVKQTNPDLITVSGDFSRSDQLECYHKSLEIFKRLNIPWTFVLGNHDNQDGIERSKLICDILSKDKNCLFEKGNPQFGVGNFFIQITEDNKPVYLIALLDSHDREEYVDEDGNKKVVWSRLTPSQLCWYRDTVKEVGVRTLLITHIPLFAYKYAFKEAFNSEHDPKTISFKDSFNKDIWNNGYQSSFGVMHEDISSYPKDGDEFKYLLDSKYTDIVLVGHDHINNFVINYQGIRLAYATKTGSGTYYEKGLSGGTVIKINKNKSTISHILIKE